jgi:hypothetical protein
MRLSISQTPSNTASNTPTITNTSTPCPTFTRTPTMTATQTETPTNTPTMTATQTETPTNTPTQTITNTPTNTETPTNTPTETPTNTPTKTPEVSPTQTNTPSQTQTITPTNTSTLVPTQTITPSPSPTPCICFPEGLGFNYTQGAVLTIEKDSLLSPKTVDVKLRSIDLINLMDLLQGKNQDLSKARKYVKSSILKLNDNELVTFEEIDIFIEALLTEMTQLSEVEKSKAGFLSNRTSNTI